MELSIPAHLPLEGAETAQLKVLDESTAENRAAFLLAAPGGSSYDLPLRLNRPSITAQGGEVRGAKLHIEFPNGSGYQTKTVTFTW